MEVVVTTGAINCANLQSNHHHQQTNTQLFLQAGCPSCRPTNNVKALKRKISYFMNLLIPSSPGGLPTLSLTTYSSWLPWRKEGCHASHQPSDTSAPNSDSDNKMPNFSCQISPLLYCWKPTEIFCTRQTTVKCRRRELSYIPAVLCAKPHRRFIQQISSISLLSVTFTHPTYTVSHCGSSSSSSSSSSSRSSRRQSSSSRLVEHITQTPLRRYVSHCTVKQASLQCGSETTDAHCWVPKKIPYSNQCKQLLY